MPLHFVSVANENTCKWIGACIVRASDPGGAVAEVAKLAPKVPLHLAGITLPADEYVNPDHIGRFWTTRGEVELALGKCGHVKVAYGNTYVEGGEEDA